MVGRHVEPTSATHLFFWQRTFLRTSTHVSCALRRSLTEVSDVPRTTRFTTSRSPRRTRCARSACWTDGCVPVSNLEYRVASPATPRGSASGSAELASACSLREELTDSTSHGTFHPQVPEGLPHDARPKSNAESRRRPSPASVSHGGSTWGLGRASRAEARSPPPASPAGFCSATRPAGTSPRLRSPELPRGNAPSGPTRRPVPAGVTLGRGAAREQPSPTRPSRRTPSSPSGGRQAGRPASPDPTTEASCPGPEGPRPRARGRALGRSRVSSTATALGRGRTLVFRPPAERLSPRLESSEVRYDGPLSPSEEVER